MSLINLHHLYHFYIANIFYNLYNNFIIELFIIYVYCIIKKLFPNEYYFPKLILI